MPQEVRDLEYLETLIDQHGIRGVLLMLSDIAQLKADHVAGNWQDRGLAKQWAAAAEAINRSTQTAAIVDLTNAEGRRKDVRGMQL